MRTQDARGPSSGFIGRALGYLLALAIPPLLTLVIVGLHPESGASTGYAYLYLGVVTAVALVFGLGPALVAALLCTFLMDYFLVPPVGTLRISSTADLQNLALFLLAALVVGVLADNRRRQEQGSRDMAATLRRSNVELEQRRLEAEEGRRSATELARVSARAESLAETDRLKSELLANVSHQLRTPLSAIVGMSSALLDKDRVDVDPGALQYLDTINSEGRRLSRLVEDLLEMARLESGGMDLSLEPVDVQEALETAAQAARNLNPSVQVSVTGATGLVLADDASLHEVLRNLIENASRYSKTVDLASATHHQRSRIEVRDRGPGVPEEAREAIFERFYQLPADGDTASPSAAGSGLGLAICRRLTQAMGGRIWCEARDGGGCTFVIELQSYVSGAPRGPERE